MSGSATEPVRDPIVVAEEKASRCRTHHMAMLLRVIRMEGEVQQQQRDVEAAEAKVNEAKAGLTLANRAWGAAQAEAHTALDAYVNAMMDVARLTPPAVSVFNGAGDAPG